MEDCYSRQKWKLDQYEDVSPDSEMMGVYCSVGLTQVTLKMYIFISISICIYIYIYYIFIFHKNIYIYYTY